MAPWITLILGILALAAIIGATWTWYKKWKRGKDGDSNKEV